MKHIKTFESFLNENINEATTEFDFDPTTYAKSGVTVEQGEDWMYGRVVGKNYTFTNKTKDATLSVSRWKEGKAPNNYTVFLRISGNFDKASKIASNLGGDLKASASTSSSNGNSTFSFTNFELSQDELKKIITGFTKI